MTQLPDIESRVRAQESMTTMLHACFKELSRDMIASFQQEAKYHAATDRELDIRFRHIDARLDRLEAITATKEDLASLESRMATKEDLASLEGRIKEDMASLESRILDAFKQLVVMVDTRLPLQGR